MAKSTIAFLGLTVLGILSIIVSCIVVLDRPKDYGVTKNQLTLFVTVAVIPIVTFIIGIIIELSAVRKEMKDVREVFRLPSEIFTPQLRNIVKNYVDTFNAIHAEGKHRALEGQYSRIVDKASNCLIELNQGHAYEYDPDKFHVFVAAFFKMARKKGEIRTTSIVDPQKFWIQNPYSEHYLNVQKDLIQTHKVHIKRTFLLPDKEAKTLAAYRESIKKNIDIGAHVDLVVMSDSYPGTPLKDCAIYKDFGYVDDRIAIYAVVDPISGTIRAVDVYIDNPDPFNIARMLFEAIDSHAIPVSNLYPDLQDVPPSGPPTKTDPDASPKPPDAQ